MYGLLFAMLLRQSLALEILPGFTLYGLLLHGQFTAFQPLKDSIRQFLRDHMGAELGMVISWIVIAPLIVFAEGYISVFKLILLIRPCLDGAPEGSARLCDLLVESQADFAVDPIRRDAVDVL